MVWELVIVNDLTILSCLLLGSLSYMSVSYQEWIPISLPLCSSICWSQFVDKFDNVDITPILAVHKVILEKRQISLRIHGGKNIFLSLHLPSPYTHVTLHFLFDSYILNGLISYGIGWAPFQPSVPGTFCLSLSHSYKSPFPKWLVAQASKNTNFQYLH